MRRCSSGLKGKTPESTSRPCSPVAPRPAAASYQRFGAARVERLWSPAGATSGKHRQIGRPQKPQKTSTPMRSPPSASPSRRSAGAACPRHVMSSAVIEAHQEELPPHGTAKTKTTIRFAPDRPLPAALVRKLVKARIAENEQRTK